MKNEAQEVVNMAFIRRFIFTDYDEGYAEKKSQGKSQDEMLIITRRKIVKNVREREGEKIKIKEKRKKE